MDGKDTLVDRGKIGPPDSKMEILYTTMVA